jgi:hypothetical protein
MSCSESDIIDDGTSRGLAHTRSERRYRARVNLMFLQLEEVLSNRYCSQNKPPEKMNRPNRTSILRQARDHILELREEVKLLKKNLSIQVETAFPDTHKYVLKYG